MNVRIGIDGDSEESIQYFCSSDKCKFDANKHTYRLNIGAHRMHTNYNGH